MSFGVVLKDCLNEANASVRNFSQITGINRGWVYNIFNGKKPLPEKRFHEILENYPFTSHQKEALSNSYYEDIFGIDTFKKIQFIIQSMNKLGAKDNSQNSFPWYSCTYHSTSQYINNTAHLIDAIIFLLSSDVKYIYTNFSFEHKKINDTVFCFLENNNCVDFSHIVNFDTTGMETHNLQNVFCSAKYASLGFNTFYYYNNHTISLQADNMFPYFFMTNKGILLYDNSLSEGLLLLDKEILTSFLPKVKEIFKNAIALVDFYTDTLVLNTKLKQIYYLDSILLTIGYYPYIFYETDDNSINTYFPSGSNGMLFLQPEGLFNFMKNKTSPYIPFSVAKSISSNDTYLILKQLMTQYDKTKNIALLKNDLFSLPQNIHVTCCTDSLFIFGSLKKSTPSFIGDFSICINNKLLVNDFCMFRDYVIKNRLCYNEKHTHFIFDKLHSMMDEK